MTTSQPDPSSAPPPPPAPAPSLPPPVPVPPAPPLPIVDDAASHTVAAPSPWAPQPPAPGRSAPPPPTVAGIGDGSLPGAPPLPPPAPRHSVARWLAVAGAVIAALGVVFMWTDASFWSANGFDLVATFLVDRDAVLDEGFTIAGLVLVLSGIAAAGALLRVPLLRRLAVVAGLALAAVGVLFVVQIVRITNDIDASFTEVIGPAPFVVLVGGILTAVAAVRSGR